MSNNAGPPQGPPQAQGPPVGFPGAAGFMPPGVGGMPVPMPLGDARGFVPPHMPQHYPPIPSTSAAPATSTSILAQHLASAPMPPPQVPQQPPSHLSQLLQQPVQSATAAPIAPTPAPIPGQFEAMRQQIFLHQQFLAEQNQIQEETRAAQLQAEQAAAAATAQQQPAQPPVNQAAVDAQVKNNPVIAFANPADIVPKNAVLVNPAKFRIVGPSDDADLTKMNSSQLCQYGREIVSELNAKTATMATLLKKVMERKPLQPGENPMDSINRCQLILERLVKIRAIIEKRRRPNWKRLTGDEYIEMMMEESDVDSEDDDEMDMRDDLMERFPRIMSDTPPNDDEVFYNGRWMPAETKRKYQIFEENKAELIDLSSRLKDLKWKIDVTNPLHLKRVDATKISNKRPDTE